MTLHFFTELSAYIYRKNLVSHKIALINYMQNSMKTLTL